MQAAYFVKILDELEAVVIEKDRFDKILDAWAEDYAQWQRRCAAARDTGKVQVAQLTTQLEEKVKEAASKARAERDQLQAQLAEGSDMVDVDYWQKVSQQLGLARAKGIVADAYERMSAVKEKYKDFDARPAPGSASRGAAAAAAGDDDDGGDYEAEPDAGAGRYSPELFDNDEDDDHEVAGATG